MLKAEQLIQTDPAEVRKIIKQLFPSRSDAYVKAYADEVPKLLSSDGRRAPVEPDDQWRPLVALIVGIPIGLLFAYNRYINVR